MSGFFLRMKSKSRIRLCRPLRTCPSFFSPPPSSLCLNHPDLQHQVCSHLRASALPSACLTGPSNPAQRPAGSLIVQASPPVFPLQRRLSG